jgi:hypothetical protein
MALTDDDIYQALGTPYVERLDRCDQRQPDAYAPRGVTAWIEPKKVCAGGNAPRGHRRRQLWVILPGEDLAWQLPSPHYYRVPRAQCFDEGEGHASKATRHPVFGVSHIPSSRRLVFVRVLSCTGRSLETRGTDAGTAARVLVELLGKPVPVFRRDRCIPPPASVDKHPERIGGCRHRR